MSNLSILAMMGTIVMEATLKDQTLLFFLTSPPTRQKPIRKDNLERDIPSLADTRFLTLFGLFGPNITLGLIFGGVDFHISRLHLPLRFVVLVELNDTVRVTRKPIYRD
jgi:hypothetical protein